jgi:hypothetical protein
MPEDKETKIAPAGAIDPANAADGKTEVNEADQKAIEAANAALEQQAILLARYNNLGNTRLNYNESDVKANGLCLGYLTSVTVDNVLIDPKTASMGALAGATVPVLKFNFDDGNKEELKRKYFTHSFFPVDSNTDTFGGGAQNWKVVGPLSYFLHYIQVLITHKPGVPPTPTYLEIIPHINDTIYPIVDGKEDRTGIATFNPVDTEEVIADYARRFEAMRKLMNNGIGEDGKIREDNDPKAFPVFKNIAVKQGKPEFLLWMKLVRSARVKGAWRNVSANAAFGFPNFLGKGVIEVYEAGKEPILHFDSTLYSHKPAPERGAGANAAAGGFIPPGGGGTPFTPPAYGGGYTGAAMYTPTGNAGANGAPGAGGDDLPF